MRAELTPQTLQPETLMNPKPSILRTSHTVRNHGSVLSPTAAWVSIKMPACSTAIVVTLYVGFGRMLDISVVTLFNGVVMLDVLAARYPWDVELQWIRYSFCRSASASRNVFQAADL